MSKHRSNKFEQFIYSTIKNTSTTDVIYMISGIVGIIILSILVITSIFI
jgi:DMSO/TMAO reductase YedYZ heme-binding membrane subunit